MPCFRPLSGWLAKSVNATGKRSIVFDKSRGFADKPVQVPCGICPGCRLERARQWAVRCYHESQLHDDNCFLTLTYDSEHLPSSGSLVLSDFQKFMKRLRKCFSNRKIRFFHCGEYGENFSRPHYHVCLFGVDFPDKTFWKSTSGGILYVSETLKNLWTFGYSVLGAVTFESACYVARYIVKKVFREDALEYYEGRTSEYVTMSRRPGLGKGWYDEFKSDVFPSDEVVLRNSVGRPPDYYYHLLELEEPVTASRLRARRLSRAKAAWSESLSDRLAVREHVAVARLNTFSKRSLHAD